MGKSKSDYDWMREKLQNIINIGSRIDHQEPVNEYNSYTVMKLIAINYYSAVFSGVARHENRLSEGFDGAVYVDLFAGAGLVKLKDTEDYVAGSTLCAMLNSKGFNYCVAVEKDKEKANALRDRLKKVSSQENFDVINGDCNVCINQVISLINQKFKKPIVMVFVDPEGMEIKWQTLQALNDSFFSCDFVINVSSSGSKRVAGKLNKGMSEVENTFSEYWGESAEDVLSEFAKGKQPEQKYQEKINSLGRIVGDIIPIRDKGANIMYYLLGYTRMTSGGSQYASTFATLNKRFRNMDTDAIINILDHIFGRGTSKLL